MGELNRSVSFIVRAVPVPQPRQRHAVVRGNVMNYTPTKHPVNVFKAACQLACTTRTPLSGPLDLTLVFVLPRPKSMIWTRKNMPRLPHDKKPDCDNLAKSVMDALGGLLWRDDAQIAALNVTKFVASGDEQPHLQVMCEPVRKCIR